MILGTVTFTISNMQNPSASGLYAPNFQIFELRNKRKQTSKLINSSPPTFVASSFNVPT